MATRTWHPRALPVAELKTITPGSVDIGDTFTLTINTKAITVTATAATAANVVGLLVTAWAAQSAGEFKEITATDSGSGTLLLTHNTAGVPFTVAGSSSGGTLNVSTTTSATGPNFWSNQYNWSGDTAPTANDDVVFENSAVDCLYGFPATFNLTSLTIKASFTGRIGLPEYNANGYYEYRTKNLTVKPSTLTIGAGVGGGSPLIRLDLSGRASTISIISTGQPVDPNFGAVYLLNSTTGSTLEVLNGNVSLATLAGDAINFDDVTIGGSADQGTGATVKFGAGVVFEVFDSTLVMSGGNVEINSTVVFATMNGGTLTVNGAGGITQLSCYSGKCIFNGTGGLSGAPSLVGPGGTLDFSQDMTAKTLSGDPINLLSKSTLLDPSHVVSNLAFKLVGGATFKDVTINTGTNLIYTPS